MKLQFSLRTVLWLTLVVALAFGWLADRWRLEREQRKDREHLLQLLSTETERRFELQARYDADMSHVGDCFRCRQGASPDSPLTAGL
jgi:hypothetical protein